MIASEHGPESPTTRLVLLTLGVFMDDSCRCFPSTRKLAVSTGLSERSVCTHLEIAANTGWIKKTGRAGNGQAWKRHSYEAAIPERALKEVQHVEKKGTEGGSARQAKGTEPLSKGTEPDDKKVLKEIQSNRPYNRPKNNNTVRAFLLKDGSTYHIDDEFYRLLEDAYPDIDLDSEIKKFSAWCYSNPAKRKTANGARRAVNSWMNNAKPAHTANTPPELKEIDFENQFHDARA